MHGGEEQENFSKLPLKILRADGKISRVVHMMLQEGQDGEIQLLLQVRVLSVV